MSILNDRRVRTAGVYLLAMIMISIVLVLLNPEEGGFSPSRLGSVLGLIALILLPVAFIAHKWRNLVNSSEIFRLEEHNLDEEELREAVRLFVYAQKNEQIEGDIAFELDDSGQLLCHYYLRQN